MDLRQLPATLRHLCLLSLPVLVASFGTVNEPLLLGQHNEHEMITRLAFQCPGARSDGTCFERRSLDQLAGYHLDFMGFPIIGGGFNGAVGSPDTLDPVPEGPEAHCDDADFIDTPGYPQNRSIATAALQRCVDHLRVRFRQAVVSAKQLLDPSGAVRPDMVDLTHPVASGDCVFAFESMQNPESGRAKCNVIEGFGRALHGVQDFYAHSNWADKADPNQPISDLNPPGLSRTDHAPFIVDLGATGPIPSDQIPYNLSTGCFVIPDKTPGESDCTGRVTHHTLTKDYGIIHLNGSIGMPGPNAPRVEAVPENFQLAVEAAVGASRDLWANFRAELRKKYGPVKSDLMICSLVRDNSAEQCHNHALAIALDKSIASIDRHADEVGLRISQSLTLNLGFTGADKVTVVDFDETISVNAPWTGPPVLKHEVEQIHDPDSQPNIGGGLALGIDEVINAYPDSYTDKGAVVLLTSGFVRHDWAGDTLIQLQRAAAKGIRVHYGCINMPRLSDSEVLLGKEWLECSPGDAVIPAVLKTGGTFLFIDQDHPDSAAHYAALIMQHGLTTVDDAGEGEVTKIWPGITPAMILGPDRPSRRFSYTAGQGESVNFTVQDRFTDGQGAAGCYTLTLTTNTTSEAITRQIGCSDEEAYYLPFTARLPMDLVLTAEYGPNGQAGDEQNDTHVDVVLTIEVHSDSDTEETPIKSDDSSSSVAGTTLTVTSKDGTESSSSDTFTAMTPIMEDASKAVESIRHSDL